MITVKFEYERAVTRTGRLAEAMRSSPIAVARPLALAIKKRVSLRGKPAQPAPPYGKGWHIVPRDYPGAPGGVVLPNTGDRFFASSADLHASIVKGSYNVSKGMWGGLTTIVGFNQARILFRGRSRGWGRGKRLEKSGRESKAKINNGLKANSILGTTHVNVLALTEDELRSIGAGLEGLVRANLLSVGPAAIHWLGVMRKDALAQAIAKR